MKFPEISTTGSISEIYIKILILFSYRIWSIAKFWLNLFVNASLAILREPCSDSVPG
jgi:hypothetical protein